MEWAGLLLGERSRTNAEGAKQETRRTGLGLSLCYGLIQEHGGRIFAQSVLGEGATFGTELAVAALTTVPATLRNDHSIAPFPRQDRAASGKTVLLVDDEPGGWGMRWSDVKNGW